MKKFLSFIILTAMILILIPSTLRAEDESKKLYGYYMEASETANINLYELAYYGTTDIILGDAEIDINNTSELENWIAIADDCGIRIHIRMRVFYNGTNWINPVKNGSLDEDLYSSLYSKASSYANIKGVDGIQFDCMRYPGTAHETEGAADAITSFASRMASSLKESHPGIILSFTTPPETTDTKYYYGQDLSAFSASMDMIILIDPINNHQMSDEGLKDVIDWYKNNFPGKTIWCELETYNYTTSGLLSESDFNARLNSIENTAADGTYVFRYNQSRVADFTSIQYGDLNHHTYPIMDGNNQTFDYNSNNGLSLKAYGDIANLTAIKIDGKEIDSSNYSLESGSTILNLKNSFLRTLSNGTHTVELVYNDGSANASFTVTGVPESRASANDSQNAVDNSSTNATEGTVSETPSTADNSNLALFIILLATGAGLAVVTTKRKISER